MKNKWSFLKKLLPGMLVVVVSVGCGLLSSSEPTISSPPASPTSASVLETIDSTPTTELEPAGETTATSPAQTETSTPEAQMPDEPLPLSVAYVKQGDLWLWSQTGVSQALTGSGDVTRVALSDDGELIAFERQIDDFNFELWAINRDGTGEVQLVSLDDLNALDVGQRPESAISLVPMSFSWVPNTHQLAFNTRVTFEGPGLMLVDDLHLVDAGTQELVTLLPAGQGGEFNYSPDGSQIAIVTPTTISLVNADGSNRREVLTYESVLTYSEYLFYARPQWALDGTYLQVSIPPHDPRGEPPEPTTLWRIPLDGSPAGQIGAISDLAFFSLPLTFSPDLARLAYVREIGSPPELHASLHVANADGSADEIFHEGGVMFFDSWSPDSQRFIFAIVENVPTYQLAAVGGGFQALMSDPTGIIGITWVDPNHYIYIRDVDGDFEFRLGNTDGDSTLIDLVDEGYPPSYDFTGLPSG